jgi:hypothetical protein
MRGINRRDYLKGMAAAIAAPAFARSSSAATAPLPTLPPLPASDALLLKPGSAAFNQYQVAYNKRTLLQPKLRALCKTPKAVATLVDWSRQNGLPLALRSGGHSYEGFSQSSGVVIDTRLMNQVTVDKANKTMTVGAGAALGNIYNKIGAAGFAFPGGSCATVGIAGLTLGGGFGFLARPFGLACDSLQWAELVDAGGEIIEADAQQNTDLFWALRGGGGGSFGAVTRMRFKVYPLTHVVRISATWFLPQARAVKLMQAWQAWAPTAPATITTVMVISRGGNGSIALKCIGQSTGSADEVKRELRHLTDVAATQPTIVPMSFLQAATGGKSSWTYPSILQKAKSDYVQTPLTENGIATLFGEILKFPAVGAICDAYGGAIGNVADDASAFAHRSGTLYSIQYFTNWTTAGQAAAGVARIRALYAAMRPHVSGAAYVNYCDLDLPDYAQAYWGQNLARLRQIKSAVDPDNVFRHAQSVPLA